MRDLGSCYGYFVDVHVRCKGKESTNPEEHFETLEEARDYCQKRLIAIQKGYGYHEGKARWKESSPLWDTCKVQMRGDFMPRMDIRLDIVDGCVYRLPFEDDVYFNVR